MPQFSVSEFSMIMVTTGKPKFTKIRKIQNRGEYVPYKDYYLSLRTGIKTLLKQKKHISYLYEISRKQKTTSKKINFEKISNNFKDWQSGKSISAFQSLRENYCFSTTSINCNPELNVLLHGQHRLVKLHFSASEKMTQVRANIICALMNEAIDQENYQYSVLDLTTGKEFFFNGDYERTFNQIHSEIQEIEKFWEE